VGGGGEEKVVEVVEEGELEDAGPNNTGPALVEYA
jgi:hypothetical protein